ncbi:MAG TPA: hypothetical protein VEU33_12170 [Archangium sp.]|nr:hypothetical protein [Archangium sp.]
MKEAEDQSQGRKLLTAVERILVDALLRAAGGPRGPAGVPGVGGLAPRVE